MKPKPRAFTEVESREVWRRWKSGQSLSVIARALERTASTVDALVRRSGGFEPPPRRRNANHLNATEREEISRGLSAGLSVRAIAKSLGRAPSTVTRELSRNGGRCAYRAVEADERGWNRARRPKRCKLANNRRLRHEVAKKLLLDWSPEQIASWLKQHFRADPSMQVSHETIYRTLFVQARGALKKELLAHLRSKRKARHSRKGSNTQGQILDAVSIRERPPEVEDRAVPGHWEGDLISGSRSTHIATLVERQSRFTMLMKIDSKDAEEFARALAKKIRQLPRELRKSLTWDRGSEMAQHKRLTLATNVAIYFCDPRSPWQRGTNENTNRLLRQYFPKGALLDQFSQADLNKVARRLNQRPRKTLAWRTPADTMAAALQ